MSADMIKDVGLVAVYRNSQSSNRAFSFNCVKFNHRLSYYYSFGNENKVRNR